MKKFILPIIISVFFLLVFPSGIHAAPNLSGSWIGFGYSFKASQTGNSITIIATDGDINGKVSLEGAVTGNTVEGRQIMIAKGCPNLEKYVPAKGTISSDGNSITITYKNLEFDPSKCVNVPGSEFEETGSYTKVGSPPAPTTPSQPTQRPQPTQTPQIKKATPVATATSIPSDKSGDQLPAKQGQDPDLVNKPSKDGNPFSIFGFNPLETWRNIQGLLDIPKGLNSLVQTAEILSGPVEIEIQVPEPAIATDDQGRPWDFLSGYIPPKEGKINVVSGQGQIKPPGSDQFIPVINTGSSSEMVTYTFLGSTFKNSGSDVAQFRYVWDTNSGAVINVSPKTEIKFIKLIPGEAIKEARRVIMLNNGEIEVKIKNTDPENKFGVQTEILDLIVIGTHFWVSHDPNSKQTVVGVYEGKVEVKTNDGKTATVTPNEDKPGVIVVAQKLSVAKLVIAGLVLITFIGGIVFFLKRRSIGLSTKQKIKKK